MAYLSHKKGKDGDRSNPSPRIDELKLTLKYAQDILDTTREPFLVLDTSLRVVTANKAFYRAFKVQKKDTEGTLIYRLGNNQWNIPELKKLLEGVLPNQTQIKDFEVEHTFLTIGRRIMLLNARRIEARKLILLSIEDATQRKELEEAKSRSREDFFQALIEESQDAIALVNPQGKVQYASSSTERVLGYKEDEFKRLKNPFELVPPDDRKRVTKYFEGILQKAGATVFVTYRIKNKSGKYIWIDSVMTNLLNDPNVNAVVINYRDVNTRVELENQKGDFIGIASHELKTPVTIMKAYTQILQRRFERRDYEAGVVTLTKMEAQINKLNALIGALLDVTKIETGKIVFNYELFNLDALVLETVENIQMTTDKHKIVIKGGVKQKIFADRERIGLVLVNLLSNAIKYSPHDVKIIVHLWTDRKSVTVGVQDFGIGIVKEKQSKLFERFFRITKLRQETYPGLGLGLYISSEIIKRHHGKMWLKSQRHRGSTFYFSLPIQTNSIPIQTKQKIKKPLKKILRRK